MAIYTYDSNVPAANNAPKNDQPVMQTNTASISGIFGQDHVGFNTANGGYHTIIHQGPQGSDPTAIPGFGQTYVKTISGDQELFYESGSGVITQLTGPDTALGAQNGYTWLPGSILLQWGVVNTTSSSGTVTFATSNIAFPNNCFIVQTTAKYNSGIGLPGSQSNYAPDSTSISRTSFNWALITNSSSWRGFYWIAIGN